jgi:hypothetical protein
MYTPISLLLISEQQIMAYAVRISALVSLLTKCLYYNRPCTKINTNEGCKIAKNFNAIL